MQWRHFFSSRSKRGHTVSDTATALLTPLGYALEARMMFDGAVAATATQADAAQNASEAAQATSAANNDTAHVKDDSQTHNDNQTDNEQVDHAVTQDNGTSDVAVAGEGSRKEVVFIDTSLTDYQTLVDHVPSGVEVVLLDGSKDGLSQLTEWAKTHSGYDAIHVLSHGGEGELQLGTLTLDSDTATTRAADLATLGAALTESGDLLLYGCEVAQDSGQSFVSLLAQITGADIAASTDDTGLGGNWDLEVQTGAIEASVLHIDSYQHALSVSNTDVSLWIDGVDYGGSAVGSGIEIFMDGVGEVDYSNFYVDIDPTTSTITMTLRNDTFVTDGIESFDLVFSNNVNGTLLAITSITADSGATTSVADISASVTGTNTTITFHVNTNSTTGNGVLVWHFTSTNSGSSDTAPTVAATGSNPTFIAGMGGSIDLFSGVTANTNDSGQTFSSLTLTLSNITDSNEFVSIAGTSINLSSASTGSLTGLGNYTVTRTGNSVTVQLSDMTASADELAGLVDGLRYGNTSGSITAATRDVTLSSVSDNGSSNNTTALSLTSSVQVLSTNSALYVTAAGDTGDDATFGSSLAEDESDGGGLSLREALYWANNTVGVDRILLQTNVTLAENMLVPTSTLLIDGQSFTLNGGGYSGFQITSSSFTFAIQNLTLTNFTTSNSMDTGGVLGLSYSASDVNLRLYNVDIHDNIDYFWGAGMIDLSNISPGSYAVDLDQVNIYGNVLVGGNNSEGVIKVFVSGTQQTLSLSLTNSAIYNNSSFNPPDGAIGAAGLYLVSSGSANATNTHVTLMNTTITGQDAGIQFDFLNHATSWVASVRNSIISGNTLDIVATHDTTTSGTYTLNGGNNLIGTSVDLVSSSDPGLAATASNAINQGNHFYVTGDGDARGMDRIRQGTVDIGAYESQYASGTSAQVDLNGGNTGSDYAATVATGSVNTGVPITDALATLTQTDGDTRLWTLTLSLAGISDGSSEYLTISQQALLAAHAAGIDISGDGSQTLTLTGGATLEAFQTALRAIVYVNVASTPTAGSRTISVTANDDASSSATSTLTLIAGNAPVVSTPIPSQSVAQDGGLNFTVPAGTFSDPDGDTLTLSATLADGSALPSWLTFNPATGTFSGTPGNADVGVLSIKVTATDTTSASVSTTFSLTVTNVNDAPVVSTTIPAQSVAQDSALSYTVPVGTFTDPDGDTLAYTATLANGAALPSWLTFDAATRTFSGTPGNADVGSLSIKVTATDPSQATISTTFSLTITNVNDAPVVSATIPAQSVAQDGSLNFTVPAGTFTDPDGDTLTLSATLADGSALPSWLTFNPATGTFTGTPGNSDVGNLSIKVIANDGAASVSTTFTLTVTNVNDAPVVSATIPAQMVAQDSPLIYTVPGGTFTDPDGDSLTFTATLADGSALPSWLTFNPTVRTFSGIPGNADVGTLSIKITASDGSASVSTTFSLTVTNVNDAPVVATTIPAQSVAQDGNLNFTVPAGTFTDPDGDTLTLSATLADGSALPSWLTFNPATGTFTGTPGNADVGSLSIKVIANDGDASVSTTFSLTVTNVNDAPVVSTPIPTQSVAQDSALSFTVPAGTFTDPDGDTLTFTATLANGSALPSWLTFNAATRTFSGTPANSDVGSLSIKVTANDGNASVSTTFSLTVTNVNDAPEVSTPIPSKSVVQNASLNYAVPAGTFSDPDGDTLTLTATLADGSALPSWLSFNSSTNTFTGTPSSSDIGILSIKVTANDGDASVSTTFNLTVTDVNHAPVVATPITAQSVAQDSALSFTVPAGTFSDPDGDTLALTATLADGSALPSWLTFNPATGTFSGTPGNADVGSLSLKITASDGDMSVSTTFSLTVTNVNDAPVVSATIPAQSVAQDGSLNFTVPAGTFTDPDGDTLTLSATLANGSPLPSWLTFNPATRTFSGTPGNADVGSLSIKVTANDGDASVSTSFSLTVTNVNDAPVVSATIPAQSVAQDGSLNFTVPAGTFTDPDGDTLTLSATLADGSPLPSWLTFNPATRTFSGTPGNGDVGSLSIKVTANDGDASVSTSFSLTVTNVNDAPVVSATIPAQSVAQDGSLNFTVPAGTFTDPDGDTLTLSATLADGSPLPSWLTFNPATRTFSGTPGNGDVGSLSIKVTANDGDASVSTSFSLTVTNVNDAPVVSATIPAQSVAQDGSLNFTVPAGTFTDPDGDTLTLSATLANGSPLPSWLSFNPATGTFSGTPGNADVGSLSIKVTANDGDASVSTSFSLTVTNVNDAPVVSATIPAQSVAQDGGLNFTVPAGTFTDPDGDTLTLSATLADGSALPSWLTFNSATRTFSGTPGNGDVGNLSIKVTANDGDASVSTSFSLTVTNVNDAPVVSTPIAHQTVAQNGSLNFMVPAGTFTDPDGDTLTLSATLSNGSPLPSWLHFNPATNTFSGTPANGDVGLVVIKVTATDGSNASVSTSFGLTVTNVNDVPVVATPIPHQSIAQDGSLNFTLPAGTFSDPDGDTLTLSATLANGAPLPSWLHFDPTIGTFSGTPTNGDVGLLVIKVTATDSNNASVSTSFGLTVTNVNDAPVVSGTIPAQSVAQDGSLNFTVPAGTFSDPDGDTLTLSATLANGAPLPSWLHFDPVIGTFSGTPTNGDVGLLVIKVTATDGNNASVSTSFGLTVTNVNDAPVVSGNIPAQTVTPGSNLNFTLPEGVFTDPDGDTLTLSATLANGAPLPSWLHFDPAIGTFSGTPGNGNAGNLVITVIATDSNNATVSTNFSLTVTPGIQGGDPQFRATNGINLTPSSSDARQPSGQDSGSAPPALGGLIVTPSLGSFTTGNTGAPGSVMSAIFSANRQHTESGTFPTSEVANTFVQGIASNVGVNFDSTLGTFPSFSKDPALGGTTSLAGTFSGIHLPSLAPMEVFSGGSWKDVPFNSANNTLNDSENSAERSVAFTPSLHRQLQQMGDAEWQRLAALEQALQDSGQQQG